MRAGARAVRAGRRARAAAGRRSIAALAVLLAGAAAAGCTRPGDGPLRASGYVEATEVRIAAEVGGRILEVAVDEGDRVEAGARIARLDTSGAALGLRRAEADRAHAVAQLRLLQAGARAEDVRQAAAQAASARADLAAAGSELEAAAADLARFDALLSASAGSRKQRDDAATRKEVAEARVNAARERARAAEAAVARLETGARREEIAAAGARVEAADAQIAVLRKGLADATVASPVAGVVTARLVDPGELAAPGLPLVIVTDLDRAWANVYVEEPILARLRLGQIVPLVTDAGARVDGRITFISPKAEFTPRNVQTAEERATLVYRIKVTTDNRDGVLRSGMPVEAEIPR